MNLWPWKIFWKRSKTGFEQWIVKKRVEIKFYRYLHNFYIFRQICYNSQCTSKQLHTLTNFIILKKAYSFSNVFKVQIFWEGHRRFVLCSNCQIYGGDFAKFWCLLRIYELYYLICIPETNKSLHELHIVCGVSVKICIMHVCWTTENCQKIWSSSNIPT